MVESDAETHDCSPFTLKNSARCMIYLNDFRGAKKMLEISTPLLKNAKPLK